MDGDGQPAYQRVLSPTCSAGRARGFGCQRIARLLEGIGVFASKSSVERLLKGQPPYTGWRVVLARD